MHSGYVMFGQFRRLSVSRWKEAADFSKLVAIYPLLKQFPFLDSKYARKINMYSLFNHGQINFLCVHELGHIVELYVSNKERLLLDNFGWKDSPLSKAFGIVAGEREMDVFIIQEYLCERFGFQPDYYKPEYSANACFNIAHGDEIFLKTGRARRNSEEELQYWKVYKKKREEYWKNSLEDDIINAFSFIVEHKQYFETCHEQA